MVLETPSWASTLKDYAPYILGVAAFFWRERAASSKERSQLHALLGTVEKNTTLLESHSNSIISLTTITDVFRADRTKDSEKLEAIDGKLNRLLGEREGERSADERHRRQRD